MLFWLKKTISFWLQPLPLGLAAIAVGLLLIRSGRRARLGRGLIIAAIGLLLIVGNRFVARSLLRSLETVYPAIPEFVAGMPPPPQLAACRYVVILGGGHERSAGLAANNLLSYPSLSRFVEGMRILRVLPEATLIVTGPAPEDDETHAAVLGRAARSFGVAPERILYVDQARDTEEESRAVKALVPAGPVALVTSAWHLPRAVALFRSAGLETVACPADFSTSEDRKFSFGDYLWDVPSIDRSTRALRERLGYLWIWLRGKT